MFDTQLSKIWTEALELIRKNISKPTFDTWFKNTELVAYVGDTIIIMTPNDYAKNYLIHNNFTELIQKQLEYILNCPIKIQFVTAQDKDRSIQTPVSYTHLDVGRAQAAVQYRRPACAGQFG